jgi:hypothetical protein
MPLLLAMAGVKGITVPQIDKTVCTYCVAALRLYIDMGLLMALNKDKCFDDIEVLAGKCQEPTGTHKHTILLGQCQIKLNGDNPLIKHCVKVGGVSTEGTGLLGCMQESRNRVIPRFSRHGPKCSEPFLNKQR